MSKPIQRWEFVVGKYGGMALVLTVLVALVGAALAAMLTYQGGGVSSALMKAVVLSWFEVLTVAAIAIFFSSFSSPFLSGIFALAMFVIGRLTPDIEAATANATSGWIRLVTRVTLEIVPDLHLYTVSGRLSTVMPSVCTVILYRGVMLRCPPGHGFLWIVGLMGLAALLFSRRRLRLGLRRGLAGTSARTSDARSSRRQTTLLAALRASAPICLARSPSRHGMQIGCSFRAAKIGN